MDISDTLLDPNWYCNIRFTEDYELYALCSPTVITDQALYHTVLANLSRMLTFICHLWSGQEWLAEQTLFELRTLRYLTTLFESMNTQIKADSSDLARWSGEVKMSEGYTLLHLLIQIISIPFRANLWC